MEISIVDEHCITTTATRLYVGDLLALVPLRFRPGYLPELDFRIAIFPVKVPNRPSVMKKVKPLLSPLKERVAARFSAESGITQNISQPYGCVRVKK